MTLFDGVPDFGFQAYPVEAVDLLDFGRRGHFDFGQAVANADEDEAALAQGRADHLADFTAARL